MAHLKNLDLLRRFRSLADIYRLSKLLLWKPLQKEVLNAINREELKQHQSMALPRDPRIKTKDANLEMLRSTNTTLGVLEYRLR